MDDRRTGDTGKLNIDRLPPAKPTKRVLIADDSATIRYHLAQLINEIPGVEVIGQARNGQEAVSMAADLRPDVVSMDIRMPVMDGLEATRRIMAATPTPVVVVSGLVEQDMELAFQALKAGALAVVEKPPDRRAPTFDEKQAHLVKTLMAMSSVSVVRRVEKTALMEMPVPEMLIETRAPVQDVQPRLIAIGASAGGPSALSNLLGALPPDFPLPIVVAQHIPPEFGPGLVRWLDKLVPLTVRLALDGAPLRPGVVHLCPGDRHVTVVRRDEQRLMLQLLAEQGQERYQPSVDVLFHSVARACGANAVGIILTGMGDDGASGLLAMAREGALTLAQDEASATVFGMPGAAIERGAVRQVMSLSDLSSTIVKFV